MEDPKRVTIDLRKIAQGAILAWAFVATVAVVALALQTSRSTSALNKAVTAVSRSNTAVARANNAVAVVTTQQDRQHNQLVQGCVRLNVLRAQDNASQKADFVVFSFVAQRFLERTKTETKSQLRVTNEFAGALHAAVASKQWTPLTDCTRAVALKGSNFVPPRSIPFEKKQPPASAMNPTNATLDTPAGSVL